MKKLFSVILTVFMITALCIPVFASSTLDKIEKEHQDRKQEALAAYESGEISYKEFDLLDSESRSIKFLETISSPSAAWEVMGVCDVDTPQNRNLIKEVWLQEHGTIESFLLSLYEEATGLKDTDYDRIPEFSYSDLLPMTESFYLTIAMEGKITAKAIEENVNAWIIVVFADQEPFCVQTIGRDEDGKYTLIGTMVSKQQAKAYLELMAIPGCYVVSSLGESDIDYLLIEENKIKSENVIHVETLQSQSTTLGEREVQTYLWAQVLNTREQTAYEVQHPAGVIYKSLGGATEDVGKTVEEHLDYAYYDLFVKPYVVSFLWVFAAGIVLIVAIVVIRFFKNKKVN